MNSKVNLLPIILGIGAVILLWTILYESAFVYSFFRPDPPKGFNSLKLALEAGNPVAQGAESFAVFISGILEVVFSLVVGLLVSTVSSLKWLQSKLFGTQDSVELPVASNSLPTQSASDVKKYDEHCRVLLEAVSQGNKVLTVAMAEYLHGKPFLSKDCCKQKAGK